MRSVILALLIISDALAIEELGSSKVAIVDGAISKTAIDEKVYLAGTSTWTKPTWASVVWVWCVGGGGGGGSGRRGSSGTSAGGGAGGAGAIASGWFLASELDSEETVTVGTGGDYGAAQTGTLDGNPGSAGNASLFGPLAASRLSAPGGKAGLGGSSTQGVQGSATAGKPFGGVAGGNGATAAGASSTNTCLFSDATNLFGHSPGGGGGGSGGITGDGRAGGNGSAGCNYGGSRGDGGAAVTSGNGNPGGSGGSFTTGRRVGGGGGGGTGTPAANRVAGDGGSGGTPGGGGGGGGGGLAGGSSGYSGNGGRGGDGICYVASY